MWSRRCIDGGVEGSVVRFVHRYDTIIFSPSGERHLAYACAGPRPGDTWEGWLVFVPLEDGVPISTDRETTQPNVEAVGYWATGLSPVYLEGALARALDRGAPATRSPTQIATEEALARRAPRRRHDEDSRTQRRAPLHPVRARVIAPRIRRAPGR